MPTTHMPIAPELWGMETGALGVAGHQPISRFRKRTWRCAASCFPGRKWGGIEQCWVYSSGLCRIIHLQTCMCIERERNRETQTCTETNRHTEKQMGDTHTHRHRDIHRHTKKQRRDRQREIERHRDRHRHTEKQRRDRDIQR